MAELPSGAVTFLFTDIEGSTRLVRELRGHYAEILAAHQRLLREAFSQHGGHEIDTQGDAFFFAFPSAHEAVLAAIDGQRALAAYPWPDGAAVRVRMGLHTGQAVPSNGRYTGLAVHRAARICAAGHGGQILVSQATQSLLEDEEDHLDVRLRDLGDQRLKDIERPVRLYQVTAPGLATEFPPPRGEAAPTEALEATMSRPLWRRRTVLAGAAVVLAALVAVAVALTARDTRGGLGGIRPNHVGIIDPETNEIVAEVPVGRRPGPIAVGGASVWVGNVQDRTLTRIDARTRTTVSTVPLKDRTPTGVAAGGGAVWVSHGRTGQLSHVDPEYDRVGASLDVAERSELGSVAFGDGSVWAVYGDSTLLRIEADTARAAETALAGAAPSAIAFGAGSLWVANSADSTVDRFNPATFEEGPIRTIPVGRRPVAIAFGEGAIWVANRGEKTVTRIDPDTYSTHTISVGDAPSAIAAGGGVVWVASPDARTISRVDPVAREVAQTIDIGGAPAGVDVGQGLVWVSAQAP